MKNLILIILLTAPASAMSTVQTRATYTSLIEKLRASGATDIVSDCRAGPCSLSWTEPKQGKFVFEDTLAIETALRDELLSIEGRLDDGTADMVDLRRWAKIMMKLTGFARRSGSVWIKKVGK